MAVTFLSMKEKVNIVQNLLKHAECGTSILFLLFKSYHTTLKNLDIFPNSAILNRKLLVQIIPNQMDLSKWV